MKFLLLSTLLLSSVTAGVIDQATLDPDHPILVEVGLVTSTVLQFPGPVQSLIATDLTTESEGAKFQYSHVAGSSLLTLRALAPTAQTTLTISMEDEVYLFFLRASASPTSILRLSDSGSEEETSLARSEVFARRPVVHRDICRTLINLARNTDVLVERHPKLYSQVRSRTETTIVRHQGGVASLEKVVQFPERDALVFLGSFEGIAGEFPPSRTFLLEIAGKRFPLTHQEWIPAETGRVEFAAVLIGDGGTRSAQISLKNSFRLVPVLRAVPIP